MAKLNFKKKEDGNVKDIGTWNRVKYYYRKYRLDLYFWICVAQFIYIVYGR